jgi:hypothetical protein
MQGKVAQAERGEGNLGGRPSAQAWFEEKSIEVQSRLRRAVARRTASVVAAERKRQQLQIDAERQFLCDLMDVADYLRDETALISGRKAA